MRKKKLLMLIESVSHWTFQSFVRSVFSYYPVRDLVTLSLYRPLLCRLTRPVTGTSSMIEFCFVRDTTHRFRRRVLLVPVFFLIFVISVTLTIGRLQPVSGAPRNRSSHADIPHFTRALNPNMLSLKFVWDLNLNGKGKAWVSYKPYIYSHWLRTGNINI